MKRNVSLATAREQVAYLANQRQLKAQAKQVVDGGGGFSAIPYDVWTGMDRAGKDALAAYALAGGQVTTDPLIFYRLRDLALDHPQDFLDTDLNDHIHQVDAKDLASLTALQATLRDKGADDPQINLLRSYKANTDRVLRQLGVLPAADHTEGGAANATAEGGDDLPARIAATFRRDVDIAISAQETATGRKATPAEQQQIVDQVASNVRRIQAEHGARPSSAIYSETDAQDGSDNSLLIRTLGGDVQMVDAVDQQQNRPSDQDESKVDAIVNPGNSLNLDSGEPSKSLKDTLETSNSVIENSRGAPNHSPKEGKHRLTPEMAFEHYRQGSGTPLRMRLDQLDLTSIKPTEFPGFQAALRRGKDTMIDTRYAFPMSRSSVEDGFLLGDSTVRLQGRLTFDKDGRWNFDGTYKIFDDPYDFNKSTHRGFIGELLTTFGRNTPGKQFDIEIRGSVPVSAKGETVK